MYLCVWLGKKLNRIKMDNIGLDTKVVEFKRIAMDIIKKDCGDVEFAYRGCLLSDDDDDKQSLADYEISEDSEIHVFEKVSSEDSPITFKDDELRKVSWELNVLSRGQNFHTVAHKVIRNHAATFIRDHGVDVDSTAFSFLQHPELLVTLREPEILRKIAKKYPSIVHAASILCEYIQAQTFQMQAVNSGAYFPNANNSSGEEEDMDSNPGSPNFHSIFSAPTTPAINPITPAQLAAAIANATANTTNSVASNSTTTTPSSTSDIITREVFSNALQQAFSNTPSSTPPITPGTANENLNFSSLSVRYEVQLGQMHELGLTNDAINIRALQTTSGNVQEAVELVLNGVID